MNDKDLQNLIKRAVNIHNENNLHLVKKADVKVTGIPFQLICEQAVRVSQPSLSEAVDYLGLDGLEESAFSAKFMVLYESDESKFILRNKAYIRNYSYGRLNFVELGTVKIEFSEEVYKDFELTKAPFSEWLITLAGVIYDKVEAGTPSELTRELGIDIKERSPVDDSPTVERSLDDDTDDDDSDKDGSSELESLLDFTGKGSGGSKDKSTQGTRTILYYMFYDFAKKAFPEDPLKKLAVFGNSPNFDTFWYNLPRTYGRDREIMAILNTEMDCTELVPIEAKPEETTEKKEDSTLPPPAPGDTPPSTPPPGDPSPPPPSTETITTASTSRSIRKSVFRIVTSAEDIPDPTSYKSFDEVFTDPTSYKSFDEVFPEPTHTTKEVKIKFYDLGFKEYNCDPVKTQKLFKQILSRVVALTNRNQFEGIVNLLGAPFQAFGNLKGLIAPTKDRFGR